MKRIAFFVCLILSVTALHAESIKLKSGAILSGSIVSQDEYTLLLATPQGTFPLNTREIEQILPDKHRIFLKGGTQLVGTILDLDEFNLKLRTEDDIVVNVDVAQIVSIETYDYEQGDAPQKIIEQRVEAAQAAAAAQAVSLNAALSTPSQTVPAALPAGGLAALPPAAETAPGGLSFDEDIARVFEAKKPEIVDGRAVNALVDEGQTIVAAPRPLTDEEAFLQGKQPQVHEAFVLPEEATAIQKREQKRKQNPEKIRFNEKATDKYFTLQIGGIQEDLILNNESRLGDPKQDVGGSGVLISSQFLWRVKSSNFWAGPMLSLANIPNTTFADNDPAVAAANQSAVSQGYEMPYPDPKVKTSGLIMTLGAAANYYINPQHPVVFYLTANAGYEMLSLDYRAEINSDTIKSDGFTGAAGIGVEVRVDDLMLGIEAKEHFSTRSKDLKESANNNLSVSAKFSWKF